MKNRDRNHQQSDPQGIWQAHISAMEQSGLSRAEYCRRRNISYHTLTYWQRKLAKPTSKPFNLVPINLPGQIIPGAVATNQTELTILLPGNFAIAVGDNFSCTTLQKLLNLLENR